MKTALTCQMKYFHNKIAQTPVDADYEESDALSLGKAFHNVLENTMHERYTDALIINAIKEFNVSMEDKPLLAAMLENYVKLHKSSGLKVVKCELKIETTKYIGYIDFVAQDEDGWWIGDLKTTSRHDPSILPRLHRDPQMNLYAHFADDIGRALQMNGPFLGIRYRQSVKSKAKTEKGLKEGCKAYDIVIPANLLETKDTWSNFEDAHRLVEELHSGLAPKPNYNACMEYFSPCQFFSQCHGCLHSEGNKGISVLTTDDYESSDLLA